jgi:pSer/pThr/pTyr-binding forkhead associated (FHA) protein
VDAYVLEIVEGPEAGRRIPLVGPVEIGRSPAAGIPLLQDDLVSGAHARLTPEDGGLRVEDLDSTNGTFVDGDQIVGPAHLAPGGQLLLGVTVLELRPASAETTIRPIPASLTSLRPLPAATSEVAVTAVRQVPSFVMAEQTPDYVKPLAATGAGTEQLLSLLDEHTKGKARIAPIGLFVLVAFAVMLFLALR